MKPPTNLKRHSDLYYVLFALLWVALGAVGVAVLLMYIKPGPFPRPFVARSTTSATTPGTVDRTRAGTGSTSPARPDRTTPA